MSRAMLGAKHLELGVPHEDIDKLVAAILTHAAIGNGGDHMDAVLRKYGEFLEKLNLYTSIEKRAPNRQKSVGDAKDNDV
jgi:hypothetical protein